MPSGPLSGVLTYLRRSVAPRDVPGVSDAELIERFLRGPDEAAFELLVWRHARMVLGVCRRVLRDEHAAEDAFQATFLALARRGGSIRERGSVGGWLYRVASRIALDARAGSVRRAAREQALVEAPARAPEPPAEAAGRELLRLIETELDRLPDKYRVPLVRCWAGESSTAIARDLGCPAGTIESRLTRARRRLRAGLVRRGVAAPAVTLAAVLEARGAPSPVPARLVSTTVRVAAGPTPAHLVTLSEGALRTMTLTRWRIAAAVLLLVAAVGGGTALLVPGLPAAPPEQAQATKEAGAPPAGRVPSGAPTADAQKPDPGRIFVDVQFPRTLAALIAGRDRQVQLVAIDPETAKWVKVADAGGFARVSPDRRTLLVNCKDGICSTDADGRGEPKRLCEQRGRPVWAPDGKHFVVTREEWQEGHGWKDETWQYNAEGSGATRLPVPDTDAVNDWSPDGKWFLTLTDRHPPRGSGYQLYRMHPDGTDQRRLTKGRGLNCYARFSRDGRSIVYLHQERGVNSLHVMDADGGNDRVVVKEKDGLTPDAACWSPDGKRLAVVLIKRAKQGATDLLGNGIPDAYHLEIMDADGGNRHDLKFRIADNMVVTPHYVGHPDWR
jgi:RNA polymerase sigma factor (sigma-70 family)